MRCMKWLAISTCPYVTVERVDDDGVTTTALTGTCLVRGVGVGTAKVTATFGDAATDLYLTAEVTFTVTDTRVSATTVEMLQGAEVFSGAEGGPYETFLGQKGTTKQLSALVKFDDGTTISDVAVMRPNLLGTLITFTSSNADAIQVPNTGSMILSANHFAKITLTASVNCPELDASEYAAPSSVEVVRCRLTP